MNEVEFLEYCQSQISGSLTTEDVITMLTAWGSIKFSEGYNKALDDNGAKSEKGTSGNAINGVGPNNPKKEHYESEANKEFNRN